MIEQFKKYITESCKCKTTDRVLVALSGGADSMTLLHLLKQCGVPIIAAHCNFNLRDAEADRDESFVREQCKLLGVDLHVISFQTKEYATSNKISIEMAARDLRYSWFNTLLKDENITYIATGHHKDDSVETFFLNLARGTGIKGLTGIKAVTNKIIRPLLTFSRAEILTFCKENNIQYVTDSSNLETVYMRNKIRNNIIPLFKDINPSFSDTMINNMDILYQINELKDVCIKECKDRLIVERNGELHILREHLIELTFIKLFLFDLLNPLGFNADQVMEIISCLQNSSTSGKQFFSSSHRLIVDRLEVIILPKESINKDESIFYIEDNDTSITSPICMDIEKDINASTYTISRQKGVGQFDADLLKYPLTIRKWQQRDRFKPLGMSNFKKLSDYFIDNKYSLKRKEDTWLLLSGDDIIWIIGDRSDDRYKISDKTKKVTVFNVSVSRMPSSIH